MENKFNNIHYKTITYKLNIENGYFEKQPQLIVFKKMPNDLKIEQSQKEFLKHQGAELVIRGRIKNFKYSFFSGLRPVDDSGEKFIGNDYDSVNGRKRLSLIVFSFDKTKTELTAYYFSHFYKDNKDERLMFVLEFLKSI